MSSAQRGGAAAAAPGSTKSSNNITAMGATSKGAPPSTVGPTVGGRAPQAQPSLTKTAQAKHRATTHQAASHQQHHAAAPSPAPLPLHAMEQSSPPLESRGSSQAPSLNPSRPLSPSSSSAPSSFHQHHTHSRPISHHHSHGHSHHHHGISAGAGAVHHEGDYASSSHGTSPFMVPYDGHHHHHHHLRGASNNTHGSLMPLLCGGWTHSAEGRRAVAMGSLTGSPSPPPPEPLPPSVQHRRPTITPAASEPRIQTPNNATSPTTTAAETNATSSSDGGSGGGVDALLVPSRRNNERGDEDDDDEERLLGGFGSFHCTAPCLGGGGRCATNTEASAALLPTALVPQSALPWRQQCRMGTLLSRDPNASSTATAVGPTSPAPTAEAPSQLSSSSAVAPAPPLSLTQATTQLVAGASPPSAWAVDWLGTQVRRGAGSAVVPGGGGGGSAAGGSGVGAGAGGSAVGGDTATATGNASSAQGGLVRADHLFLASTALAAGRPCDALSALESLATIDPVFGTAERTLFFDAASTFIEKKRKAVVRAAAAMRDAETEDAVIVARHLLEGCVVPDAVTTVARILRVVAHAFVPGCVAPARSAAASSITYHKWLLDWTLLLCTTLLDARCGASAAHLRLLRVALEDSRSQHGSGAHSPTHKDGSSPTPSSSHQASPSPLTSSGAAVPSPPSGAVVGRGSIQGTLAHGSPYVASLLQLLQSLLLRTPAKSVSPPAPQSRSATPSPLSTTAGDYDDVVMSAAQQHRGDDEEESDDSRHEALSCWAAVAVRLVLLYVRLAQDAQTLLPATHALRVAAVSSALEASGRYLAPLAQQQLQQPLQASGTSASPTTTSQHHVHHHHHHSSARYAASTFISGSNSNASVEGSRNVQPSEDPSLRFVTTDAAAAHKAWGCIRTCAEGVSYELSLALADEAAAVPPSAASTSAKVQLQLLKRTLDATMERLGCCTG